MLHIRLLETEIATLTVAIAVPRPTPWPEVQGDLDNLESRMAFELHFQADGM